MGKPALVHVAEDNRAARAVLADAIAMADRARSRRDLIQGGIDRAHDIVSAAVSKLEDAQAGVKLAQDAHADRVAAAATDGTALVADRTLRDARLAEAEASDELVAARRGLEKLLEQNGMVGTTFDERLRAQVPIDNLTSAQNAVKQRVDEVFRATSFDKFIAETAALQRDLIDRRLVLYELIGSGLIGEGTVGTKALSDLMAEFRLPQRLYRTREGVLFDAQPDLIHVACRHLREAREALKSDANAPLPW